MVEIKLLTKTARCPKKGSQEAAGYDIYADGEGIVFHGSRAVIDTGISMKIPSGHVGLIKPRSGLALKHGIDTLAGVIDSDYRGEVKVMLTTHMISKTFEIKKGERIAQILIVKVENKNDFVVVDDFDDTTERGQNGFGSSGMS